MTRKTRPCVGITADLSLADQNSNGRQREAIWFLPWRYLRAIESAGGIAVILPATRSAVAIRHFVDHMDGLLISGGDFDIHPSFYGEKPIKQLGAIKQERTEFELELTRLALRCDLPILGICGGAQTINVVLGGSLFQDIPTQIPTASNHQSGAQKKPADHRVRVQPRTRLFEIVRRRTLKVNTRHHQAIRRLGEGLIINAAAPDGVIEGIESQRHSFVLGVQWHPELLSEKIPVQRRLFSSFMAACMGHD